MKWFVTSALSVALLASLTPASVAAPPGGEKWREREVRPIKPPCNKPPAKKKTYGGSGTVKIVCKAINGKEVCKPITEWVRGCPSKAEAERQLELKLEARARAENGRLKGKISFNVKLEF